MDNPSPATLTRSPFHLLAKPTGAVRNLDCTYCFFLSKEMLYPGSRFRMADDLLAAYLVQLLDAHRGLPEVVVAWQGGESTMMGLDFFRRSVEITTQHAEPGQRVLHSIQANGTLIDDAWAAFFKENDVLVGLSIDGPREIHDTYRVDKGGKPSFDRVMAGLAFLQAREVEWNALTTVHAANEDRGGDAYRFLRDDLGARFMQFIPIIERADEGTLPAVRVGWGEEVEGRPLYTQSGSLVTERSASPEGYGRFLTDVYEEWIRGDIGEVYVQMFDTALANWLEIPGGLCIHQETCGRALALEHNGDLYSCDHFVEPDFLLGNIRDKNLLELVNLPQQQRFGADKRDTLPRYCLECDVRFACHGGCPKDRFTDTPDGEPGLNYLCPSFSAFFGHIDRHMKQMGALMRSGHDAPDLLPIIAAEDARRGRNDPCTCGSGRKWKVCHGPRSTRGNPISP